MGDFRRGLLFVLLCSICAVAEAQDRDVRGERLLIDDGNSNTIILKTPPGPIVGGILTIPDPAGAGTLLISNPTIGWQSVTGHLLLGGEVRFLESGIGPDYVGFAAPAAVPANQIWTLPATDGANGDVLTTNGSGALSWTASSGTVSTDGTLTGNGTGGNPLGLNLSNANTWTGTQTFPTTTTQGDALIGSTNAGTATVNAARIGSGLTDAQVNNNLTINGGTVDATAIGTTTPSTGRFTTGTLTSELRLVETAGTTDYVGFVAPANATANQIWTLPVADGTNGQALTTNGAGVLSWATPGGGAATSEPFITAAASGTLSAERVLTGGTGVSVFDGGANSTMTVSIGQSVATSATPIFAGVTIPTGNVNITTGNLAITTGNISTTVGNISTTTGSITTTAGDVGTSSGNIYADNGGELRLLEPDGSGSEYTAFKSGAQSGNITYTLPATNGTAGQVLRVASAPAPTGTTATLEWGTASGATGFGSVGGMIFVRKGTDESVVSSTTLQNDDDLVVALNANETYQVDAILYVTTTNAGHDFKIAFTIPSGASMKLPYSSSRAGSTNYLENDVLTTSGSSGTVVDLASGNLQVVTIRGTVQTGGNSGDLQLQWADDNTGGTQTVTVETDSFLKVTRVE